MKKIDRLAVKYRGRSVGTLSLSADGRLCVFEYSRQWLADGFSVAPLDLPLRSGVFQAEAQPFYGNFGIFEDSLPDGYGRYLLHKALLKEGVDDSCLSALDRLSLVGCGGMGALTYEPENRMFDDEEVDDFDLLQAKALDILKERSDDDAELLLFNSGNSGGCRPKAVFKDGDGHWLVKFRHTYDPHDMGRMEFHHNSVARACGLDVADFRLIDGRYFASRRFDIDGDGQRMHIATAGGLMNVALSTPVLDYSNLLALTGYLTRRTADVEEMFRRMVFNYLTDNKDDHCKNFSFRVIDDSDGNYEWRLAPAYDLTVCTEGYNGEHATSVNKTGRPMLTDMLAVGTKARLDERRCREIFDEVRSNCGDLLLRPDIC